MTDEPHRLARVAEAIGDGSRVDWSAVREEQASESARALLEQLAFVERIAVAARAESVTATAQPLSPLWGHLRILAHVGRGQYGDVYRAWDTQLHREVALKLLHGPASRTAGAASLAEAQRLARVEHPGLVTVYGAGCHDDLVGVWMAYVHGTPLSTLLDERGALPAAEAARLVRDVSDAVAALHAAGVLHRDIKADNVIVGPGARAVLVDLGAGVRWRTPGEELPPAGTPLSLPPEAFEGGPIDERTDVYGLGVLLYRALSARHPVMGTTVRELRDAHRSGTRLSIRAACPGVPPGLADVVERALAPDPRVRYSAAGAVRDALDPLVNPPAPFLGHIIHAAFAAVVMAAVVATGIVVAPRGVPERWTLFFQERADGDEALTTPVTEAIAQALGRGRLPVVPAPRVDETLALMRRRDRPITDLATAQEVTLRDGRIPYVVRARTDGTGSTHRLVLEVLDAQSARVLAATETRGTPRAIQPQAVGEAVADLVARVPAGEARPGDRPEPVTTSSIAALRLYSEAYRLGRREPRNWHAIHTINEQALHEDPQFASAAIWRAWCLLRTGAPEAERVAAAGVAVRLAEDAAPWERHWITGSAHYLRDELDEAVREYRALVALQPDHYWGTWNLMSGLRRLERHPEAVTVAAAYAQRHPDDSQAQAWTVDALIRSRQWDAAAAWASLSAVPLPPGTAVPLQLSVPIRAVTQGDPAAALSALRVATAQTTDRASPTTQQVLRHLFHLWMGLGRVSEARSVLRSIDDATERTTLEGDMAWWLRDFGALDRACTMGWLDGVPARFEDRRMRLAAQSGQPACLAAIRGRRPIETRQPMTGAAELLWGLGDFAGAERQWRALTSYAYPPGAGCFIATTSFARMLHTTGRTREAIELLERGRDAARADALGALAAPWWLEIEAELLTHYEAGDRSADARRIRRDLQRRLALAESEVWVARVARGLTPPQAAGGR